jgi:hypothetical protein
LGEEVEREGEVWVEEEMEGLGLEEVLCFERRGLWPSSCFGYCRHYF